MRRRTGESYFGAFVCKTDERERCDECLFVCVSLSMRAKLLDMDSNENDDSKADFEEYRPVTPEFSHNGQSLTLCHTSFKKYIYIKYVCKSFSESCSYLLSEGSESEEGGSSPCGSPKPDHPGPAKNSHRALLSSAALLASVALGRCLEVQHPPTPPPRASSRTHLPAPEPEPEVVGDLITFSTDSLPRGFLDLLKPPEIKPLPLTPPPPNPRDRERPGRRTQDGLGDWTAHANGDAAAEVPYQSGERRRRASYGLPSSHLGETEIFNTNIKLQISVSIYCFISQPDLNDNMSKFKAERLTRVPK